MTFCYFFLDVSNFAVLHHRNFGNKSKQASRVTLEDPSYILSREIRGRGDDRASGLHNATKVSHRLSETLNSLTLLKRFIIRACRCEIMLRSYYCESLHMHTSDLQLRSLLRQSHKLIHGLVWCGTYVDRCLAERSLHSHQSFSVSQSPLSLSVSEVLL